MSDFFSGEIGQTLEMFGLTHLLLLLGFIVSIIVLSLFSPKIRDSKYEKVLRFVLIGLVFLFEWRVFESRMLNTSIFRLPLCAISLYTLTFAVAFKKERLFKICYFYAFGAFLTFVFFDTPWGLDRWGAWTFFGAHATIIWLSVYGIRVLGYKPTLKDLHKSILVLAIYAFISGYAVQKHGGADELFLFHAPVDFANAVIDIHPLLYLSIFSLLALVLMYAMYLPMYLSKLKIFNK